MGNSSSVPAFSLTKDRYNQKTFLGRVRYFYSITDPRTLLVTDAQLNEAQHLLQCYREGKAEGIDDARLWEARRVVESVVHPNNGEKIAAPFRFSAFAPMNIFIVTAMLIPSTMASVPATIFIHWFNQSYNSAVNFANRNTSNEVSGRMLAEAYGAAVTSSVSIALGATFIIKKAKNLSPAASITIKATLPFMAVLSAGLANLYLIRRNEWQHGVQVVDQYGDAHGQSIVAGKQGLAKCGVARLLWNFPIMVMPPIIMGNLRNGLLRSSSPRTKLAAEAAIVTGFLFAGVPPALAFFPQRDTIAASKLEPHLQNLRDRNGQPIEEFYFNKGL